jgi:CcmD family protein
MTMLDMGPALAGLASDVLGAVLPCASLLGGAIQDATGSAGPAAAAGGAVTANPEGVLRGLRFLTGAYTVVWLILAAYLVMLSFRQRRLARQIRRLKERLGA